MAFSSRDDQDCLKFRNRNGTFEVRSTGTMDLSRPSPVLIISMPELVSLKLRGPVQVEAGGFSGIRDFSVDMGPGVFLSINSLDAENADFLLAGNCRLRAFVATRSISMESSGNPNVTLGGHSGSFSFVSEGSSKMDGTMLLVDSVDLDLKGMSEIRITPDESMKIHSLDSAVIYYNDRYMENPPEVEGPAILRKY